VSKPQLSNSQRWQHVTLGACALACIPSAESTSGWAFASAVHCGSRHGLKLAAHAGDCPVNELRLVCAHSAPAQLREVCVTVRKPHAPPRLLPRCLPCHLDISQVSLRVRHVQAAATPLCNQTHLSTRAAPLCPPGTRSPPHMSHASCSSSSSSGDRVKSGRCRLLNMVSMCALCLPHNSLGWSCCQHNAHSTCQKPACVSPFRGCGQHTWCACVGQAPVATVTCCSCCGAPPG
jgi:hypothetical protein